VQDLKKARWYLDYLINEEENKWHTKSIIMVAIIVE
jgi:hypothetical protein